MSCVCDQILVEIRELKNIVNELAGQGRGDVPERFSLSHKEEFQRMLARHARLEELARKREQNRKGR